MKNKECRQEPRSELPHIAIVILNWNGADMLRQYLPSVLACSHEEGVQVMVADNASTDESLQVMSEQFPQVPVIRLERNYGFAEGYNRALAQVEADYFLLLNSDVEIRQPHWLQPMLTYMDAHADVAACQPKLLSLREPTKFEYAGACGGFIDRLGYPYCRGRLLATVEEDHGQYDTPCDIHWATGAALLIRSGDWRAQKGFCADFFAHQEEIDLCWRLRRNGRRIVCIPQSTAYHLGGGALAYGHPRKTFLNHRNNLLMLRRNLPPEQLQRVMRWRWWLDRLTALNHLLHLQPSHARAVMEGRKESRTPSLLSQEEKSQGTISSHEPVLLWQYYVLGHKTFSQLPRHATDPIPPAEQTS